MMQSMLLSGGGCILWLEFQVRDCLRDCEVQMMITSRRSVRLFKSFSALTAFVFGANRCQSQVDSSWKIKPVRVACCLLSAAWLFVIFQ